MIEFGDNSQKNTEISGGDGLTKNNEIHKIKNRLDYNLEICKNKRIVIWGAGENGKKVCYLLRYFGVEPYAFCDSNKTLQNTKVLGLNVMSPSQLDNENKNDLLIFLGNGAYCYEVEIRTQLLGMGINFYISYAETLRLFLYKKMSNMKKIYPNFRYKPCFIQKDRFDDYFMLEYGVNDLLFLCLPQKTGDHTLNKTLENNGIQFCQMWHRSNKFNKNIVEGSEKTIKMITAIREPISQSISAIYQAMDGLNITRLFEPLYSIYGDEIPEEGIDVQLLYDAWIEYNIDEYDVTKMFDFFEHFQENIVDIFKYPFDKEKGYTIVKEGSIEIFIYQLEKLNNLVPELAEFVGGDFTELIDGNKAEDKWYNDSYNQAKKELKFTQEYIDNTYSHPYITHFYSDEDIQKFKSKWKNNIK